MSLEDIYKREFEKFSMVSQMLKKAHEIEQTFSEFRVGGVRYTAVIASEASGIQEVSTATYGSLFKTYLTDSGVYPEKLVWEPLPSIPNLLDAPVSRAVCFDVRKPYVGVVIYKYEATLLRVRAKVAANGEPT